MGFKTLIFSAILVVFDLSNIYSLANCKNWLWEAEQCNQNNKPFIFLIGTKKDLLSPASYKQVEESALKIAKKLKAEYWPISSKTGENIDRVFNRIAALTFDEVISKSEEKFVVNIGNGDVVSVKRNKPQIKPDSCYSKTCKIN